MVINHVLGALIVTTEPETLISWHQADAVIFQEEKEFNYSPSARDPWSFSSHWLSLLVSDFLSGWIPGRRPWDYQTNRSIPGSQERSALSQPNCSSQEVDHLTKPQFCWERGGHVISVGKAVSLWSLLNMDMHSDPNTDLSSLFSLSFHSFSFLKIYLLIYLNDRVT